MKKIYLLIIGLLLFSSQMLWAQEHFYYYQGKKQPLEINTEHIFLSVSSISKEALAAALPVGIKINRFEVDNAPQIVQPVEQNNFGVRYWAELNIDRKLSVAEYTNIINELKKIQGIEIASPYFQNKGTHKIGLSNYFYVKLKNATDLVLLQEKAKTAQAIIVGQNKFMPLWFTVSCTKQSPANAMRTANTLYETQLFEYAEPDLMVDDIVNSNDPLFPDQWGLQNTGQNGGTVGVDIKAPNAWKISTGANVTVAVLDQGIEMDHPDLQANIIGTGFDTENGTTPSVVRGDHGTACAGIIGARQDNTTGISGVAPNCGLMSISNSLAATTVSRQRRADGINWAVNNGAAIISSSWGSAITITLIDDAITNAIRNGRGGLGTVVVFASGNDNGTVNYPANSNADIIAVGAMSPCGQRKSPTSCDGETRWGSNFGAELDIVAPGVLIPTTDRQGANGYNTATGTGGDYYNIFNGTSAACPHIAGVAALILSANPCLTQRQVGDIIERSAQKLGTYTFTSTAGRPNGTWNNEVGYGLVNAEQAVLLAQNLYLQNRTETGVVNRSYQSVLAGKQVTTTVPVGNYIVPSGATVNLKAVQSITLKDGCNLREGASFTARIDPSLACTSWTPLIKKIDEAEPIISFKNVEPVNKAVEVDKKDALQVYPNPFTNKLTISYNNIGNDKVSIEVFSMAGVRVAVLQQPKTTTKGNHSIDWDAAHIPSGVYIIVLTTDAGKKIQKVVKL